MRLMSGWASGGDLIESQRVLAAARPPVWQPNAAMRVGGCFVCFERGPSGPGRAGEQAFAAAALAEDVAVVTGAAGAPYEPGLLALREGALLEAAVRALPAAPDVLIVNATGRDHPRRAGLALHLGAVLDMATVGITHRPLVAAGDWPVDEVSSRSPLRLAGALVGYWVRTNAGTRPLAVHAAWRTDPETAVAVALAATRGARTPEPLRLARRRAREARARSESLAGS